MNERFFIAVCVFALLFFSCHKRAIQKDIQNSITDEEELFHRLYIQKIDTLDSLIVEKQKILLETARKYDRTIAEFDSCDQDSCGEDYTTTLHYRLWVYTERYTRNTNELMRCMELRDYIRTLHYNPIVYDMLSNLDILHDDLVPFLEFYFEKLVSVRSKKLFTLGLSIDSVIQENKALIQRADFVIDSLAIVMHDTLREWNDTNESMKVRTMIVLVKLDRDNFQTELDQYKHYYNGVINCYLAVALMEYSYEHFETLLYFQIKDCIDILEEARLHEKKKKGEE